MRIGPYLIKLKPILIFGSLIGGLKGLQSYSVYETAKKELREAEEAQMVAINLAAERVIKKEFPEYVIDKENNVVPLEELNADIKVLIYSDAYQYPRIVTMMSDVIKRKDIAYYSVQPMQAFHKIHNPNFYGIDVEVSPQVIVYYKEKLIYSQDISKDFDAKKSAFLIKGVVSKQIEREFLDRIKF